MERKEKINVKLLSTSYIGYRKSPEWSWSRLKQKQIKKMGKRGEITTQEVETALKKRKVRIKKATVDIATDSLM